MIRKICFWIVPFFLCCLSLKAQSGKTGAVLAQELKRFEAMTLADTSALKSMLAEELIYIHSNAMTETKSEHISAIGSGRLVYERMERLEAKVRLYGKSALITGLLAVQGRIQGNAFSVRLLYTALYRKHKGKWILHHWQSTKKG